MYPERLVNLNNVPLCLLKQVVPDTIQRLQKGKPASKVRCYCIVFPVCHTDTLAGLTASRMKAAQRHLKMRTPSPNPDVPFFFPPSLA
jgi:hypothetical protein